MQICFYFNFSTCIYIYIYKPDSAKLHHFHFSHISEKYDNQPSTFRARAIDDSPSDGSLPGVEEKSSKLRSTQRM